MKLLKYFLTIIIMCFYVGQVHSFSITNVTLTGPGSLCQQCPPGGTKTYTITITGTGWDPTFLWMNYTVYDEDAIFDDILIRETPFHIFGTSDAAGNWKKFIEFDLFCNTSTNCNVAGKDGSSGESVAEVYTLIESEYGSDLWKTAAIPVACVIAVTEPKSILLMWMSLLAIVIMRKKQLGAWGY